MRWKSGVACLMVITFAGPTGIFSQQTAKNDEQVEVYFTPFSHLDFFWGGTREECLARGNGIIAQAIKLAKESAEFRFLLEDEVFVANYLESHKGLPELEDFKRLVKEGRIEIPPKWAAIFQGLPDGEVHARNMALGKRYARAAFGVDPLVAHSGDLPDYTPQFPQILSLDDVVRTHVTLFGDVAPGDIAAYKKGLHLVDEAGKSIPFHIQQYSENISRALDIIFIAQGVPSLGYKTYYLVASDQPESPPNAAQVQLDRDKDLKDFRRALGSDVLENEFLRVTIDKATGRPAAAEG